MTIPGVLEWAKTLIVRCMLQIERFSHVSPGDPVANWPIEEAFDTLQTIEGQFEPMRSDTWQSLLER